MVCTSCGVTTWRNWLFLLVLSLGRCQIVPRPWEHRYCGSPTPLICEHSQVQCLAEGHPDVVLPFLYQKLSNACSHNTLSLCKIRVSQLHTVAPFTFCARSRPLELTTCSDTWCTANSRNSLTPLESRRAQPPAQGRSQWLEVIQETPPFKSNSSLLSVQSLRLIITNYSFWPLFCCCHVALSVS